MYNGMVLLTRGERKRGGETIASSYEGDKEDTISR
jgi:hypothetical protein